MLVRGTWEEERILVFSRTCFWMIWCGLPQSLLSPLLCRKRACCRLPIPAGLSRSLQAGRCDTCSHYLGSSVLITANMVILFPNRANCSCCLAAVNFISKHVLHVAALPKQNCKCHKGIVFFFQKGGKLSFWTDCLARAFFHSFETTSVWGHRGNQKETLMR